MTPNRAAGIAGVSVAKAYELDRVVTGVARGPAQRAAIMARAAAAAAGAGGGGRGLAGLGSSGGTLSRGAGRGWGAGPGAGGPGVLGRDPEPGRGAGRRVGQLGGPGDGQDGQGARKA